MQNQETLTQKNVGYIFKKSKPENPERWLKANHIIEQFNHHAAHHSLLVSLHFSVLCGGCIVQEKMYISSVGRKAMVPVMLPGKALAEPIA